MENATEYPCSYDNTMQKAMYWIANSDTPRPLVVVLHTWSYGWDANDNYLPLAKQYNYHMIGPDYRGSNTLGNPLSMGSDASVQDIMDAVTWMQAHANVDSKRIYLIGGSGGGYMSLLVAVRHPEIWAGISTWCPITDLRAWCEFHNGQGYGGDIIANLNGDPRTNDVAAKEAQHRSPLFFMQNAQDVPLDIATGIHDGHTGSVPISHALNAFNAAVPDSEKIDQTIIDHMTKEEKVPAGLPEPAKDPGYGKLKIHFRKTWNNTRITIFEGSHDLLTDYGFGWLSMQQKGKPVAWQGVLGNGDSMQLTK